MIFIFGIAVSIFLAAFFCAAEMAFLSTDRVKLRNEAEKGNLRAQHLLELYEDSREFLTVVLIGKNGVDVLAAVLLTTYLDIHFGIHNEWVVTAILVPILVVFGETVPKGYGRNRAQIFLMDCEWGLRFFFKLFAWPTRALLALTEVFTGRSAETAPKNIFVNEDEFRFLIEESARVGVLEEHEKKFVERILDFERVSIEKVFVSVGNFPKVELLARVREAKEAARQSGAKVVLVYEEIPTIIIGMIYVFDLLFEEDGGKGLREYLRAPIFLPKETSLEKAFLTLQEKRQSFALVTDARRDVAGLVEIENLLAL